jgi:hypothetical protein
VPETKLFPCTARAVEVPAVEVPIRTCPAKVDARVVDVAVRNPT